MNGKIKYEFQAKIWLYTGQGGWHFVSLPQVLAKEIRDCLKSEEEGWGRLKVTAKTASSQWETAIWFDTQQQTYLLPLKAEIRKREKLKAEDVIDVILWI